MPARSIHQWFAEYGESHRDPTNKAIHWVCVPAIHFCVLALLWSIPTPAFLPVKHVWALLAVAFTVVFYARLSLAITLGMLLWCLFCLWLCRTLERHAPWPLWAIAVVVFTLAWIGQFYGHKVEGKKPSFLKDLQFLMIGPAWLMGFVLRRLGVAY